MVVKKDHNPIFSSERGSVVMIVALGLMLLLLVTGFAAINFGMIGRANGELQLAVDNAATSAASQLCSNIDCYEAARKTAVEILAGHNAASSIGSDSSLEIDADSIPKNEYTWDIPDRNLKVSIERGVWKNNSFESFEGDWPAQHPGVPAFVAANSVRIRVLRPETQLLKIPSFNGQFSLSASSTAVKGSSQPALVAPFALPVCALINNEGKYYGDQSGTELCKADRFFTRADRYNITDYWSAHDARTGYRPPAFPWTPCNTQALLDPYTQQITDNASTYSTTTPIFGSDGISTFSSLWLMENFLSGVMGYTANESGPEGGSCITMHGERDYLWNPSTMTSSYPDDIQYHEGWGWSGRGSLPQPVFKRTSEEVSSPQFEDLFGVVGLPTIALSDGASVENSVLDNLRQSTNPIWSVSIGDQFTILPDGYTNPQTDSLLWATIINGGSGIPGIADGAHPEIGNSPLGTFVRQAAVFNDWMMPVGPGGSGGEYNCSDYYPGLNCIFSPAYGANLNRDGVEWIPRFAEGYDGLCNSHWVDWGDKKVTLHVSPWDEEIGFSAKAIHKPNLDDHTPVWKTVVPVIADTDASAQACVGIDKNATMDPVPNPGHQQMVVGFVQVYFFDVDIGHPQPQLFFTYPGGYTHRVKGWGFREDFPEVDGCNTVHARLDCQRTFIPDSQLAQNPVSKVVE